MINSGESMTPVFFSTWQCLHKSEFDIYEVLVDAPKQRHLKINYFATEKEPHNSKVPGSKAPSSKRFSKFSSLLFGGMCVIYSTCFNQKIHSQYLHKRPFVHSTGTTNKVFACCSSSAATSGNAATSGPCFPRQFQSFWFWLLWCFILSEVISAIFSNTSYEEKGKRWESRERPNVIESCLPFLKGFFPLKNLSHKCVPLGDAITPLLFWKYK